MPQQKFRFLTVAARFPVHDEVDTNARKPSRDRQEAEQLYWRITLGNRSGGMGLCVLEQPDLSSG